MKRALYIFLMFAVALIVFTACTPKESQKADNSPSSGSDITQTPDETETPSVTPTIEQTSTPEEVITAENTLISPKEKITLGVIDSKLYVTYLGTLKSNINMISEKSEFVLPKYGVQSWKVSDWKFASDEKFVDKVINGIKTDGVIYNFEEKEQGLNLRVYCLVRPDISGAFEFYTELDNLNDSEIRITPYEFSSFTVTTSDPNNTNLVKLLKESRQAENINVLLEEEPRTYGPGVYNNPIGLKDDVVMTTTNANIFENNFLSYYFDRNSVDGIFVALEWSNGRITAKRKTINDVRFSFDMDIDNYFTTRVPAGDTFVFPSTYILPYDGKVDNGSNVFKSWFFNCKVPQKLRDDEKEPLTQVDQTSIILDDIAEIGVESIKWDYGWWTLHGYSAPYSYEGSWEVRRGDCLAAIASAGCINLSEYGDFLKKNGVNLTLYVLFHDTRDLDGNITDAMNEFNSITHPEWFSARESHNKLADLGNVNCVSYLKDAMYNFFANNNVSTWRSDFEPIPADSDKENRHDSNGTDVMYWNTVGFAEIVDYLYDNIEGFRYESCAQGGGMKDFFTATKAVVINCDDSAYYLSLRASFYDSSYVIHPTQLQLPTNIDAFDTNKMQYFPYVAVPEPEADESYDFREAMLDMGFRSTFLGVPHWCSWQNDRSYLPYYKKYISMYKDKVRLLVRNGELYHILPRPDGKNWDGIMYADPDSSNDIKGAAFIFKPSVEVADTYNVVFDGLYEDTLYQLNFEDRPEQNCKLTGKELMTNGINVEIKYIGSEIIWITEAE